MKFLIAYILIISPSFGITFSDDKYYALLKKDKDEVVDDSFKDPE